MNYAFIGVLMACCFSFSCAAAEDLILKGQLLDENGMAPLANLYIFSDSRGTKVTQTDAMGFFDYPVKKGLKRIHVLPYSSEVVGRSVFINVDDFRDSVFKIVVERGVTLRVKVVAKNGKPIAGAKVSWYGSGGARGVSGADGIAQVGRISRYKNGNVLVRGSRVQGDI